MKQTNRQTEPPIFPDPPEHLSERSKELWRTLGPGHARSLERRTLFQAGLEALDTADRARHLVETEGMISTTKTTGAVHVNPLTKIERESRAQFVRIWALLALQWNYAVDSQKNT